MCIIIYTRNSMLRRHKCTVDYTLYMKPIQERGISVIIIIGYIRAEIVSKVDCYKQYSIYA